MNTPPKDPEYRSIDNDCGVLRDLQLGNQRELMSIFMPGGGMHCLPQAFKRDLVEE